MVAIPAGYALRLAERLGLGILAVLSLRCARSPWRPSTLARRAPEDRSRARSRPRRALAAVTLAAAILSGRLPVPRLPRGQGRRAGYADVEQVAPPPTVSGSAETAGSAHLYVLLLAAIAAGVIVVLSMLRPLAPRAAAAADRAGLPADHRPASTRRRASTRAPRPSQFQGAEARLLGAFWVQLTSAAVIALCGATARRPALRPERARPRGGREPAAFAAPAAASRVDARCRGRSHERRSGFRLERLLPFAVGRRRCRAVRLGADDDVRVRPAGRRGAGRAIGGRPARIRSDGPRGSRRGRGLRLHRDRRPSRGHGRGRVRRDRASHLPALRPARRQQHRAPSTTRVSLLRAPRPSRRRASGSSSWEPSGWP